MEEPKEYSVFEELSAQKPRRKNGQFHRAVYWGFICYSVIRLLSRWASLAILMRHNLSQGLPLFSKATIPFILLTIPATIIVTSSIILYLRKSMRAAIALLILGAVIELAVFYFLKTM